MCLRGFFINYNRKDTKGIWFYSTAVYYAYQNEIKMKWYTMTES